MNSFDYIIVGGGTAGSVIAARLSQDPGISLLLLEAGAAQPLPEMSDPAAWFALWRTSVDWDFETVPQRATQGAVHRWPRGKVLGGSSGINAMMHYRGDRTSYDAWERAGAAGWNYDALLPYLRRSERAIGRDPRYRGLEGPMKVAPLPETDPLWEAFFDAGVEAGNPPNEDANGPSAVGTGWLEHTIVGGVRQSAADAYLTPIAGRANLEISAASHVRRLLIKDTKCRGVEYSKGGQLHRAFADRDVIVSAGAIGTPHLMMLSGVGPAAHLHDVGIKVVEDLPGVGANLHDHLMSQVAYAASQPVRVDPRRARKPVILTRSNSGAAPDLQMFPAEVVVHPRFAPAFDENGYSIIFSVVTPASRGSIRLVNADPYQHPLIDPNYLADGSDLERMVIGLRRARSIGAAAALGSWRAREVHPGPDVQSDVAIESYLRGAASTYFHPVGTCKIGTDGMSVVDPRLSVYGIENLRIADASVMPSIVSANTNAAVLGIAERAASLIGGESASDDRVTVGALEAESAAL